MRNQSDKFRRWDSQQEKLISFFIKLNHKKKSGTVSLKGVSVT